MDKKKARGIFGAWQIYLTLPMDCGGLGLARGEFLANKTEYFGINTSGGDRYRVRWFDGSMVRWFDGSMVRWFDGSRYGVPSPDSLLLVMTFWETSSDFLLG